MSSRSRYARGKNRARSENVYIPAPPSASMRFAPRLRSAASSLVCAICALLTADKCQWPRLLNKKPP